MTCGSLCLQYDACQAFAFDQSSKCVVVNVTQSLVRTSPKNNAALRVGIAKTVNLKLGKEIR